MKKISATLAIGILLSLGACSEYDFDSKYEDPSKVNEVSIDSQWDNLYSALTQHRKMESLYNDEAAGVQAQNEAFMLAAKIHLYDFFAATVDIFGDMPFKEACMLPITNDVSGSYAHYDKAEDIYKTIMDELKEAALRLPEVNGTIANVPNRWRYPTTEMNYNPYYKEVQDEDTYYTKLFWAK